MMARLPRTRRAATRPAPTLPATAVPRPLLFGLLGLFVLLLLLDLAGLRYGYLGFEKAFGGWAITALFAGVAALLLALALRPLLLRRPDHYGDPLEDDAGENGAGGDA